MHKMKSWSSIDQLEGTIIGIKIVVGSLFSLVVGTDKVITILYPS